MNKDNSVALGAQFCICLTPVSHLLAWLLNKTGYWLSRETQDKLKGNYIPIHHRHIYILDNFNYNLFFFKGLWKHQENRSTVTVNKHFWAWENVAETEGPTSYQGKLCLWRCPSDLWETERVIVSGDPWVWLTWALTATSWFVFLHFRHSWG